MLIAVLIIAINGAALFVAFYLKNTKIVGIILISCGAILLVTVQLWGLPGLVLYIVSGVPALREKLPSSPRKYTIKCLTCGIGLKSIHSDFAKAHLEYMVVVEIRQIDDTKKSLEIYQPTDSIDSDRFFPANKVNKTLHFREIFLLCYFDNDYSLRELQYLLS